MGIGNKFNKFILFLLMIFTFSVCCVGCKADISDLIFEVPETGQAYYNTYYEVQLISAIDKDGNIYKPLIEVFDSEDEAVELNDYNAFLVDDYAGYTIQYTIEYKKQRVIRKIALSVIDYHRPVIDLKRKSYIVDPEIDETFSIPQQDITITDDITKFSDLKINYKVVNGNSTYTKTVNEFDNDFENGCYYTVIVEASDSEGNKAADSVIVMSNRFGFEDEIYNDLLFGYNEGNWNQSDYEIKPYEELDIEAAENGGQNCLKYTSVMSDPGGNGWSYADFILCFNETLIKGTKISFDYYCQKPSFNPECSLRVGSVDMDNQMSDENEIALIKNGSEFAFNQWNTFTVTIEENIDELEFEMLIKNNSGDAMQINFYIDNIKIDLQAAKIYGPEIELEQKTFIVIPGSVDSFTIPVDMITVTDNFSTDIAVSYKVYYFDEEIDITNYSFDIDFENGGYYNIIIEAVDEHGNKTYESIQVLTNSLDFDYDFYEDMIYGYKPGNWPQINYSIKPYSELDIEAPAEGLGGSGCLEYSPVMSNPGNDGATYADFVIYFGDVIPKGTKLSFMYYVKKPGFDPVCSLKAGIPDLNNEFGIESEIASFKVGASNAKAFNTWYTFYIDIETNISAFEFEVLTTAGSNDATQMRFYIDNIYLDYTGAYNIGPKISVPQETYIVNQQQITIPVEDIIITDNMTDLSDMIISYNVYYNGEEVALTDDYTFDINFEDGGHYAIVIQAEDEHGNITQKVIRVLPNIAGVTVAPQIEAAQNIFFISEEDNTFTIPVENFTITDNFTENEDLDIRYKVFKNGQPVELLENNAFALNYEDGITYVVVVEAEDEHGNIGTLSVTVIKGNLDFEQDYYSDMIFGYRSGNWNQVSYNIKQYGDLDITAPEGGGESCLEYSPVMSSPGGDSITYADIIINFGSIIPEGTRVSFMYYFKKPDYNPDCSFKVDIPDTTAQLGPQSEVAKFNGNPGSSAFDIWHTFEIEIASDTDSLEFEMYCDVGSNDGRLILLYIDNITFITE